MHFGHTTTDFEGHSFALCFWWYALCSSLCVTFSIFQKVLHSNGLSPQATWCMFALIVQVSNWSLIWLFLALLVLPWRTCRSVTPSYPVKQKLSSTVIQQATCFYQLPNTKHQLQALSQMYVFVLARPLLPPQQGPAVRLHRSKTDRHWVKVPFSASLTAIILMPIWAPLPGRYEDLCEVRRKRMHQCVLHEDPMFISGCEGIEVIGMWRMMMHNQINLYPTAIHGGLRGIVCATSMQVRP